MYMYYVHVQCTYMYNVCTYACNITHYCGSYWYAWILVECVTFYDPCEAYYVSSRPLASQSNTMDALQN